MDEGVECHCRFVALIHKEGVRYATLVGQVADADSLKPQSELGVESAFESPVQELCSSTKQVRSVHVLHGSCEGVVSRVGGSG